MSLKKMTMRQKEVMLAYGMLIPPVTIVFLIVLFPVLADIWISFKDIQLADLRAPTPSVSERVSEDPQNGTVTVLYRLRNRSSRGAVEDIVLRDTVPAGLSARDVPQFCEIDEDAITCSYEIWPPRFREDISILFDATPEFFASGINPRDSETTTTGHSVNALLDFNFTLDNFRKVFSQREFWKSVRITVIYTVFGTIGAIALGLFAALLMNTSFRGRAVIRGLLLFPFVAPVIAVAFTWVFFLDPFSGVLNMLLVRYELVEAPINFLGTRVMPIELFGFVVQFPVALATVIAFEAWRYFPLSFLFILARLQALPSDIYEAADIDGASPIQKFRFVTMPQLVGILSILFMLRFIWTFNKFDDIFLMTGGNAGTRTLTVGVYDQAFALSNLGAGAAVSVVIFFMLAIFMVFYFIFMPKGEML